MSDFWVFGIETTRHVLTGALEYVFSHHIGNVIIPADELIFQVAQPPTSVFLKTASCPGGDELVRIEWRAT